MVIIGHNRVLVIVFVVWQNNQHHSTQRIKRSILSSVSEDFSPWLAGSIVWVCGPSKCHSGQLTVPRKVVNLLYPGKKERGRKEERDRERGLARQRQRHRDNVNNVLGLISSNSLPPAMNCLQIWPASNHAIKLSFHYQSNPMMKSEL